MITGFAIENFKGIRERVAIELRPLTLLFGANSAGKSTILHALHYAWEGSSKQAPMNLRIRNILDAREAVRDNVLVPTDGRRDLFAVGTKWDVAGQIRLSMASSPGCCQRRLIVAKPVVQKSPDPKLRPARSLH